MAGATTMVATPTRLCTGCAERKTVRGVWYLVAPSPDDPPAFFCESCYQGAPRAALPRSAARRLGSTAPEMEPPGLAPPTARPWE